MAVTTDTGARTSPLERIVPGIKIAAQMTPEPREMDLQFVRQMGVEHVVLWTDAAKSSAEYYASRKALFRDHGLSVYGFGNGDVHNQEAIVLGLPNRDAKVEEYKRHLQSLGAAGIPSCSNAVHSSPGSFCNSGSAAAPAQRRLPSWSSNNRL